jgi:outer membrane lipoprotein
MGSAKMKIRDCFQVLALFCLLSTFTACAPISKELRAQAEPLSFAEVFKNPQAYKGKIVIWGGEIIQTTNQKDGTSLIEVFQRPLDWEEEPESTRASGGRFLVLVQRFLDLYIYREGKEITVAGEIIGEKMQLLGQMEYRYPLLLSKQIYLWRGYHYYYYPFPYYPYYPYHPRWYYGPWYYDPWWWDLDYLY